MSTYSGALDLFKGRHFDKEIIVLCVRWYLSFKLSSRDLVQMMAERGIVVAHTTILRHPPTLGTTCYSTTPYQRDKNVVANSARALNAGLLQSDTILSMRDVFSGLHGFAPSTNLEPRSVQSPPMLRQWPEADSTCTIMKGSQWACGDVASM